MTVLSTGFEGVNTKGTATKSNDRLVLLLVLKDYEEKLKRSKARKGTRVT